MPARGDGGRVEPGWGNEPRGEIVDLLTEVGQLLGGAVVLGALQRRRQPVTPTSSGRARLQALPACHRVLCAPPSSPSTQRRLSSFPPRFAPMRPAPSKPPRHRRRTSRQ